MATVPHPVVLFPLWPRAQAEIHAALVVALGSEEAVRPVAPSGEDPSTGASTVSAEDPAYPTQMGSDEMEVDEDEDEGGDEDEEVRWGHTHTLSLSSLFTRARVSGGGGGWGVGALLVVFLASEAVRLHPTALSSHLCPSCVSQHVLMAHRCQRRPRVNPRGSALLRR